MPVKALNEHLQRPAIRLSNRPAESLREICKDTSCGGSWVSYSRHVSQNITPQQAQELISQQGLEIVDVREIPEWHRGHLPGSRHVPLNRLKAAPKDVLSRDGVLFVCAAGVRSETAAQVAEEIGFTNVYSLSGGTRGWASAGLPLVRD
jgi:rhodanese-related sulfurtransferase